MKMDLTGQRFTRLTVLGEAPKRGKSKKRYWLCLCDCGKQTEVFHSGLRGGGTKSCGCWAKEAIGPRSVTHGQMRKHSPTPEYKAWQQMKARCYTLTNNRYSRYGGRGITVCDRWRDSFENFFADMGVKPDRTYCLDRIDNDGNYEPGNVKWSSVEESWRNRSITHWIEFQGETQPLIVWARRIGIEHSTLIQRLKAGWSIEKTLTTPLRKMAPRKKQD